MSGRSKTRRPLRVFGLVALTALLGLGCSVNAFFSPELLRRVGLSQPAVLPDPTFLQLVFANDVSDPELRVLLALEMLKSDGSRIKISGFDIFGVSEIFDGGFLLEGHVETSQLLDCDKANKNTIDAIAVGKLDDPQAAGAAIWFPSGAVSRLLPFGSILRRGFDYDCGQIIRVAVVDDPVEQTEWRIQVTVTCNAADCGSP